jgi:hypothetical protein
MKQVAKALLAATKGTSTAAKDIAESRTNEDAKAVLELVAKDKKAAKLLAAGLLDAKDAEAIAEAFAAVKQEIATAGSEDPEVIMRAKVDSVVSKYVMRGEIAMSKIKDTFNKAAQGAQNTDDVDKAMFAAKDASEAADKDIAKALEAAVKPLGGNYDLTKAKARIATALAAGRAEVRLNHAKVATHLRSREFDKEMGKRLSEAKSDADAMKLLQEAKAQAANQ